MLPAGVLRPLGGEAVEDAFAKANQLLLERSPPGPVPRRDAVLAAAHDVQDEARVLQEPGDQGVVDRDVLVPPVLEADLQGTEDAPDEPHADLRQAVALRVIGG